MAHTHDSRRFYIDQDDTHAFVRTVPVRRGEVTADVNATPATHQFEGATPDDSGRRWRHGVSSRTVSQLFRASRGRSHRQAS